MKIFFMTFTLLTFSFSYSHASETKESVWLGTFAKKKLTQTYSYWIETQVRYGFEAGSTNQVLYRTGVLQKLNEKQGLGYLYAHIQSKSSREHRFTLQHEMKFQSFRQYKLSHRARLEARLLEGDSLDNAGRARYLLRAETEQRDSWGFVVWDELFINLNKTDWNGDNVFERNRLFIGVKRPFLESNRYEVGYLNQFAPRDSGDISEHVLVLYLFF